MWKSQPRSLRRVRGIPSCTWAGWDGWAEEQLRKQSRLHGGGSPDHLVWMYRYGLVPVDPSLADLDDISIKLLCGAEGLLSLGEYFRTGRRAPAAPSRACDVYYRADDRDQLLAWKASRVPPGP
ncbi:hypothetical protein diail_1085 [Diaporthe ilicicola]|nr:hypothetical protein diail_1085 [Diaporthe ilicicola]